MPRICAAHLDRLRERPLEAGATTTGVHGTFWNGANSCGAGPMLESGRWAVDCAVSHGRAMGYERRRYRGYVNLYRSERNVAEKSPTQIDQTLRLTEPFTLHYGDRLPDAKVAFRLAGPEDAPVIAVLGGISAHRIVAGSAGAGWGPGPRRSGLGRGNRRYRGLGSDRLGGRGGTPPP